MIDNSDIQDHLTNEDSYDSLVATIEASQGFLTLLIASCEPGSFQNNLIRRYEAELARDIPSYRVKLNQLEPSLRGGLEALVNETPQLKLPKVSGVITVTGAADLGEITLWETEEKSPLDKFFGYLQWTREGLRAFPYPIVLWVTPKILTRLSMESPDFWSWRSGVFRFVPPVVEENIVSINHDGNYSIIISEEFSDLPLDELREQVLQIEKQNAISPGLATLYDRVGQAYTNRVILGKSENRQWEIQEGIAYFQKAITLQTNLNLKADRVNSLRRLGNFYYNLGQYKEAELFHKEAIEIARQIGDKISEAASLVSLGNSYQEDVLGNRAENLEKAIACYRNSLEIRTREAFPVNWAMTQNNLGIAYSERIKGEKADNLEIAIACYRNSLEIYTREAFPVNWAMTQNNLGAAYSERIKGEKADNLEIAIACYRNSLEIYTREAFPQDWAMTQNNLGAAYSERIKGEKADNLEIAIICYNEALKIYTQEAFPQNWAMTQNNLEIAYNQSIREEDTNSIETLPQP